MNTEIKNLMSALNEIFGENITVKAFSNGTPVVDIENGVNKLDPTKKEEERCTEPETPTTAPAEDSEEAFGPGERFTDITPSIVKDDFDETYLIRDSAAGNRIISETEISFDYTADDGVTTPGVRDSDLIWILLYRNKENPKMFSILKSALECINEENSNN